MVTPIPFISIAKKIVDETLKRVLDLVKDQKLRSEIKTIYHDIFTLHEHDLLPLCSDKEFVHLLFQPAVNKSIDGLEFINRAEKVAKNIDMLKNRLEIINILKSFILDCKNHFTEKEIELGRQPVAYQDLYTSLDQQAISEQNVQILIAKNVEFQEDHELEACRIEIEALREALIALAKTDEPGVEEAVGEITKGNPEAAESIFRKLKERKVKEGETARQEASIAACHLGSLAFLHDISAAISEYKEAVALDPHNIQGWFQLGNLLNIIGDLGDAVGAYQRVRRLCEDTGRSRYLAIVCASLGNVYRSRGDLSRAEEMLTKSLDLYEELGCREGIASQYGNLGIVSQIRGDLSEAEDLHTKSIDLYEEVGCKKGMVCQWGNLGHVYRTRGYLSKSKEMYAKCLKLHEELDDKKGMAIGYGNLGNVYQTSRDFFKAEEMYAKSLDLYETLCHKAGIAGQCGNLGSIVYQIRGDLSEAEEMLTKSLELFEELDCKEGMASQYGNLGIVYQIRGDLSEAEDMHTKSIILYELVGCKQGMANEYGNLGQLYKKRGDLPRSKEMYTKCLENFEHIGAKYNAWLASLRLTELNR